MTPVWLQKTPPRGQADTGHGQWDDRTEEQGLQVQSSFVIFFEYDVSGDNADTIATTSARRRQHVLGHGGDFVGDSHKTGELLWGC